MLLLLSLLFNGLWASTNGKLYQCDATPDPDGDSSGSFCVFARDDTECSEDETLECLPNPLLGNQWIDISGQELGKAMVANSQGAQINVSPRPWTDGDQLVTTESTITGDDWAYALAFSMVGPLREKMMVEPWVLYPEDEWNKYTRAFTDCLIKVSDGEQNDLSSSSVHNQLNTATQGSPVHTYLQYLEEAAIDLVCLMTDLTMARRRRLSGDRCAVIRETWGINDGTKCDCWKNAYIGIYGKDPLMEEGQFSDCSSVGSTTSTTESSSTDTDDDNAGGNTGGGANGPTCCDGSSATCADGSTTFPCASGAPICDDGSNAIPPNSGETCPDEVRFIA